MSALDRTFARWTGFGCFPPSSQRPGPPLEVSKVDVLAEALAVEDLVLADLATLTSVHGPWDAAALKFGPIKGDQR